MNTVNYFVGKKAQIAAEHLKEIMTTGKEFFDYLRQLQHFLYD